MYEGEPCLIIGQSIRPLAQSACSAGIKVYGIDMFADQDTMKYCEAIVAVGNGEMELNLEAMFVAMDCLDSTRDFPIIYGSGFEHQPETIRRISRERRCFGNSSDSISQLNNPEIFFHKLQELGIPFPESRLRSPGKVDLWLKKKAGSTGGIGVTYAEHCNLNDSSQVYFQKFTPGRIVTATLLASDQGTDVVGFSEQWCSSNPHTGPFSYGGAVALSRQAISNSMLKSIHCAAEQLSNCFELRGLLSFDMVVNEENWYLLEINPRPGFTFELHEGDQSFVTAHWRAFNGLHSNIVSITASGKFIGHSVVYASSNIQVPKDWTWPGWICDVPKVGEKFSPGFPVCTVYADSSCSDSAKAQLMKRHDWVSNQLESWTE